MQTFIVLYFIYCASVGGGTALAAFATFAACDGANAECQFAIIRVGWLLRLAEVTELL